MPAAGRFPAQHGRQLYGCLASHPFRPASHATSGGGHIVLLASGAALLGLYGYTSYAPAKFAVRGLAEALRSELAPDGIAVTVAYPPDTDTPGLRAELRARPPILKRLAAAGGRMSADQVAATVLHGVRRGRFVIAPGLALTALALLHSLIGPWLHRFWFDPLIRRLHHSPPQIGSTGTKRL